jgi:hypothetical protein
MEALIVAFIGKALLFIIIVLVLAVVGVVSLVKKAV